MQNLGLLEPLAFGKVYWKKTMDFNTTPIGGDAISNKLMVKFEWTVLFRLKMFSFEFPRIGSLFVVIDTGQHIPTFWEPLGNHIQHTNTSTRRLQLPPSLMFTHAVSSLCAPHIQFIYIHTVCGRTLRSFAFVCVCVLLSSSTYSLSGAHTHSERASIQIKLYEKWEEASSGRLRSERKNKVQHDSAEQL